MPRTVLVLTALLASSQVDAHAVAFDFLEPAGAANRTDGGFAVIKWLDGLDPQGTTTISLFASRLALSPFDNIDGGIPLTTSPIPVADPDNSYAWDSSGVEPGCYQPYARLDDPVEGEEYIASQGTVTVVGTGNVPPSISILNQPYETPEPDYTFTIRVRVDEPDDPSTITLRWLNTRRETQFIARDLPLAAGTQTASVLFDMKALPATAYFLHAEVSSADGRRCDSYWPGYLYLSAPYRPELPDAGPPSDGGTITDAGAESDGGDPSPPPSGCGCGQAPSAVGLLALLVAWVRRRRRDE